MTGISLPFTKPHVRMGIYPAINVMTMLGHLLDLEEYPGAPDSLKQIANRLSSQMRESHALIFAGIGAEALAVSVPIQEQTTFPQFIQAIEKLDAVVLRDRLLHSMTHSAHLSVHLERFTPPEPPATLLSSVDEYLTYMAHGDKQTFYEALHRGVHALLSRPVELQQLIVGHLRTIWREIVLVEWERSHPILEDVVQALAQNDFSRLSTPVEVLEFVSGRSNLQDVFDEHVLSKFETIVLIPSRHTGPYVVWYGDDRILYFIFGARKPAANGTVLLDKGELLNRMQALADETRLEILLAIQRHEELSTQQIMEIFDLNKSAASRHLRLLRANELVYERRENDNKSKYYSLNAACISALTTTLKAMFIQTGQQVDERR